MHTHVHTRTHTHTHTPWTLDAHTHTHTRIHTHTHTHTHKCAHTSTQNLPGSRLSVCVCLSLSLLYLLNISVKARDLKSEIESLSKEFEKQIDRKMAITQSLITDMEQSEEQQMMRMRRYAESLDELIGELLSILSKIRWRLEITTLLPERTKCHYIRSLTKPDLLI